jgi:polyisoprenoid-binding protein YceI
MVFTLLTLFAFGYTGNPIKKNIDIQSSKIEWKGYKVLGSHTGTIAIKNGAFDFDENGVLKGGSFIIDMNTIQVTDLSGKGAQKLRGHLTSDDFFGVEKYPEATFVINKVVSRGKTGEYKIIGDLTIKDQTKELKFNANIDENQATADFVIDRSEFDIRYGSGSFFDNLGDKTIYDEFDLSISLKF